MKKWENGSSKVLDEVEVDMSPFINCSPKEGINKIKFTKSDYQGTVLEIEFKITEGVINNSNDNNNNNGVDFDEDVPVSSKTTTTMYQGGSSRDTASMPGLLDEIYRLNL